ncbi:MMPL family transporter [Lactiplantibacillus paraplantarum]|uniref:MMPL family transporter n=1 Tax=Lactiplantibacillus paraplantarum TaxID=60520 RepID=UPI002072F354|nr:MMPL family transporter [Lactiplantibacillus paraplantarum]
MRKLLTPKLLFLFFWGIVVFASILILPNITTFVNEQTALPQDSTTSTKYQQQWGHGLAGTQSLTLVFNNPNGKLSNHQHQQITTTLSKLNHQADDYGINQLRTPTGMTNDRQLLRSNDGSTELALVAVQTSRADVAVIGNQLNNAISINGLTTSVTSTDLIYQQHAQQQRRDLMISMFISSLLSLIILGFIFRSVLVPLLNLLCQAVTLITTVSFITNARLAWHWPLTANAIGLAGLISLILTSLLTWHFMHTYWQSADKLTSTTVSLVTLRRQYRQWLLVLIPILIITLMLSWTTLISLASAWTITIAVILTLLAVPTLNYAFTVLLGDNLFWPGSTTWPSRSHNLWGQLSKFSHWQPALGGLAAIFLVVPGLVITTRQFADDNLQPWRQAQLSNAELGQQLVQAHFGTGATAPITITVRATNNLTQQRSLQTIDHLTTKLQAVTGVARVISVTQPTGQPLNAFYVKQQLALLNIDLAGKQASAVKLQHQLTADQTSLERAATGHHTKSVDQLSDRINDLANLNDQLTQQLQILTDRDNDSNNINQQLTKLNQLTDQITTALNHVVTAQTTVATEAGHIDQHIHNVNQSLKQTVLPLKTLLASLKSTQTYLSGLATSQIGHSFYLPTNVATNQAYQNSLFTNISSDRRMTQLTVTLKTAPTSASSRQTLQRLQQVTHASLLATPLAHATVLMTGVTPQQSQRHTLISHHAIKWIVLGLAVFSIILWLEWRSLAFSILITVGLVGITLTSWGWTQLILTHWLQIGALSSSVLLSSLALLKLHWLLITATTSQRQNWVHQFNANRLKQHFYYCGQLVWPVTIIEWIYLLPLLFMSAPALKGSALMSLIGISISNLIVPLIFPGWIRWTAEPPALTSILRRLRPSTNH